MRFGRNRATAEATPAGDSSPGETAVAPSELAGLELLMASMGRCVGWIATGGQRASDWLNAHPDVPIVGFVAGESVELPSAPPTAPMPSATIERDDIVWILPPPLPPNRHLRLHRRRILVHLELEEYNVSGQVHVRPGADAVDQVMRGPRDLVPLTDVQVVSRQDPNVGMVLPVLVVNRLHVQRVDLDAAHDATTAPDPVEALAGAPIDPRIAWLPREAATASVAAEVTETPTAPAPAEPETHTEAAAEPSGAELLGSALTLLLEAGIIDVVEFQSIRARIPSVTTAPLGEGVGG